MTDTAMVPRKPEGHEPVRPQGLIDEQLADQLLGKALAEGVELLGPDGLLCQVTKAVLERALAGEMTAHLGYEKHDPAGRGSGNSRNGMTGKTLLTDVGGVELQVPGIAMAASTRRSCGRARPGWRASTTGSSRCMRAG